jgi:VWFA-related protein
MKVRFSILATALFVGFAAPELWSQPQSIPLQEQEQPASKATELGPPRVNDPSYKIDATLVNVEVLVTDEDGRVLSGLKRGNFRVFDNGSPREILDFEPTTAPVTIVMLMEYSSASYNYFAGKAADWGTNFLNYLEPRDWIALVTFDLRSRVQVDFTHRQFEVRDAIAGLGPPQFGEVNLHDALIETLDKLDRVRGRKSILLLATGLNSFSAATQDDVSKRLKETDTALFCVGLAEAEYTRYGDSSMSYLQGKNALSAYAKQTGGLAIFPRFEGELPDIFRSVVGFLRSEYTLTFRPPMESRDGLYHRLKVEIVGPEGKPLKVTNEKGKQRKIEVNAREGYVAPKKESSTSAGQPQLVPIRPAGAA